MAIVPFAGGVDGKHVQPVGSREEGLTSSATLPKREKADVSQAWGFRATLLFCLIRHIFWPVLLSRLNAALPLRPGHDHRRQLPGACLSILRSLMPRLLHSSS